ncbi:MAG: hypothetical protein V4729_07865 [Pseudomonadota bacterium]
MPHPMQDIQVVNEPCYTFGSTDNATAYPVKMNLSHPDSPISVHGIIIDGNPTAVFGSSAGASGVHAKSLLVTDGRGYLAVGNHIACFRLPTFSYLWSLVVDPATCFGIYYSPGHKALISHGELEISCFTEGGEIIWSTSGADIFTGPLELTPNAIEVTDFEGRAYRFAYDDGRILS